METPRWWPLITAAIVAAAHCLALSDKGDLPVPGSQDSTPRPALPCHKISVSNIDFAFGLYRQLARAAPGENLLFSPASVSTAMASLAPGSPVASRAPLLEGLGFNLSEVTEAEVQDGFRDLRLRLPAQDSRLLLAVGQRRFGSPGSGTTQDLGDVRKQVDDYVTKQTQGRLGAWGEDLACDTTAVQVNPMFFRAPWAQPFDPHATSLKKFFVEEHRAVQVPMMKQKARLRFFHDPELQGSVLQMDHAEDATTFFVFPNRGKMAQLEDALLPETLIKWDSLLRTRELDFYFPKFSISSTLSLESLLPAVAVGGGFLGQAALNVSKVTHKARMTLDEEGSEAVAATVIQLSPKPHPDLQPPAPSGPELSRPFLVMTFHTETGSMLFLGKVVNPLG
ncbi:putative serpin A13 [Ctenodactylus gundi]